MLLPRAPFVPICMKIGVITLRNFVTNERTREKHYVSGQSILAEAQKSYLKFDQFK